MFVFGKKLCLSLHPSSKWRKNSNLKNYNKMRTSTISKNICRISFPFRIRYLILCTSNIGRIWNSQCNPHRFRILHQLNVLIKKKSTFNESNKKLKRISALTTLPKVCILRFVHGSLLGITLAIFKSFVLYFLIEKCFAFSIS